MSKMANDEMNPADRFTLGRESNAPYVSGAELAEAEQARIAALPELPVDSPEAGVEYRTALGGTVTLSEDVANLPPLPLVPVRGKAYRSRRGNIVLVK